MTNIRNQANFLATCLESMQAEMDSLNMKKTEKVQGDNVVDLDAERQKRTDTKVDAALFTGTFSYRPPISNRNRATVQEVFDKFHELCSSLESLGLVLESDDIPSMASLG